MIFRMLILCSLIASFSGIMNASEMILKGVVIPEYKTENNKSRLKSLLRSKEAVYKGNKIYLDKVHMEIYGNATMKVESEKGVYNSRKKTIEGRQVLKIKDPSMKVEGEGYHISLNDEEIKLFKEVKIEINKAVLEETK